MHASVTTSCLTQECAILEQPSCLGPGERQANSGGQRRLLSSALEIKSSGSQGWALGWGTEWGEPGQKKDQGLVFLLLLLFCLEFIYGNLLFDFHKGDTSNKHKSTISISIYLYLYKFIVYKYIFKTNVDKYDVLF